MHPVEQGAVCSLLDMCMPRCGYVFAVLDLLNDGMGEGIVEFLHKCSPKRVGQNTGTFEVVRDGGR